MANICELTGDNGTESWALGGSTGSGINTWSSEEMDGWVAVKSLFEKSGFPSIIRARTLNKDVGVTSFIWTPRFLNNT